jgi:hypothetical protein
MFEFDKLPKALRAALAKADHNWNGEQLQAVRRKRSHPAHHKVNTIPKAIEFLQASDKAKHDQDAAAGLIMGGQR